MHMHHHDHGDQHIDESDKPICPVMHIPVSKKEAVTKGLVREYEGKTYYLCCQSCESMFDINPQQYIGGHNG